MIYDKDMDGFRERYDLISCRIAQIPEEDGAPEPFRDYFVRTAKWCLLVFDRCQKLLDGRFFALSLEELEAEQEKLYSELKDDHEDSYLDLTRAVGKLGKDHGRLLSFLREQLQSMVLWAMEGRWFELVVHCECFVEIYDLFLDEDLPSARQIQQAIYWFEHDYAPEFVTRRIGSQLDPGVSHLTEWIERVDTSSPEYLFSLGNYISDDTKKLSAFIETLPESQIRLIADTFTEGYFRGFDVMGIPLEGKKYVSVRGSIGFERIFKVVIRNFRERGLEPVFFPADTLSLTRGNVPVGYVGMDVNPQRAFDHRQDSGLYMDKALWERKLWAQRMAYQTYRDQAASQAGPACFETFGQAPFTPVIREEAVRLSPRQQKLALEQGNLSAKLVRQFMDPEKTSYTIMAFPTPEIGPDFEAIFREMIRVNTLDNETYKQIQQRLIDTLDQGRYVYIRGKGGNRTNMKVCLRPLSDPEKETAFENCTADVNIPLGEVFTSPVLKGTEGTLHVPSVFLNGIRYMDLTLRFADGMIVDYGCGNGPTAREGQKLIEDDLLFHHETLPLGEFAIGTNTTAYAAAEKYHMTDRLPILIVEKMGPHFAVGDTCYSWSEDRPVYNPDGKEVVARDNEISALRGTDVDKAYFHCHTDITIPYDEIGEIFAVTESEEMLYIMRDGRFVLEGCEELNRPLDENINKQS